MQRNMDLVRTILMRIEASYALKVSPPFGIVSAGPEEVSYYVHIMKEDGLIEAVNGVPPSNSDSETVPVRLTWRGHEFLDLARDQTRWLQAKARIAKVGSAPIAVWMKVLNDLVLKDLGIAS